MIINVHKILPVVPVEILIQNIYAKYGGWLNILCWLWCNADVIMCREYQHGLLQPVTSADSCWIAALLRWWTLSGSLMTNCWSFTTVVTKTPKTITFTHFWKKLDFFAFSSKMVLQHTPLAKWLSFWITRRLLPCCVVLIQWKFFITEPDKVYY